MKSHVINPDAYGSFKAINFLMLPIISGLIFKTLETSYRRIFELPARHLLFGQASAERHMVELGRASVIPLAGGDHGHGRAVHGPAG